MLNIKIDSRKVNEGDTFVAIVGANVDGHDYIDEAIKRGATKLIISKDGDYPVEKIVVNDTKDYLTNYLVKNYSEKINKIDLIGVTGTNGKTTTCFLTYQMLKKLNKKVAYIGTIGFYFEDKQEELPNTTPDILDLYDMILKAIDNGCDTVVMEVSSHALEQQRIAGLKFKIGAFTNLTQDHLDYHKTMENYLQAKLKILNYISDNGLFITNIDDNYGKEFNYKNTITLGFKPSDYQIINYQDNKDFMNIKFKFDNTEYTINVNLKSKFNVYNYLTALIIVNNLGYSIENIFKITKDIYPPKGRCEQIKLKKGLAVVDYAHTPDAVLKIIEAFKENRKGKIITIVGCGGDRDPKKRPIMGEYATENSDYVIFSDDNPRTEDNKKIMQDILTGVKKNNYEVIYNRKDAICKGLSLLEDDDVLLILGKGHENYQIIGREKHHFDDAEVVRDYNENTLH